ncbi:bifunctional heptose 7-phosphate kinase/heptose 1-phosphate adenyltransferase [Neolewinella maritima]|uniref:bifunctional heptose 7-phosphate kinase/heptose 1-phosphate adenyltransferase n=1 Tax=Neolewinella maritima TaxID=1383882 RepID=UPI001EE82949|nr:bifunctional ADP-heptose synthase [Neolewinella maritima]
MPALPDFAALRVLVVGDVMIDRYLTGRVDRISPEAPVPVVRWQQQEDRLGGAANVALNVKALGAWAAVAGAVGTDPNAASLHDLLVATGLPGHFIVADPDRPTTVKTRVISQEQQLLRVDQESTEQLPNHIAAQLVTAIAQRADEGGLSALILQDYNKGVLSPTGIAELLQLAGRHGILTAVDPKADNFWNYRGVDLFKPNLREVQQQLDFAVRPRLDDLDRAAAVLFGRLQCKQVMITLSQHGIYTHDGSTSAIHPTPARRIADVSGAGDTVISVAACALASGMSVGMAAQLANVAGAQVIARPGVVAVELNELRQEWARLG